ncbi:Gfo/Idh/MocA family protein [Marinilabilia rubra]|uniref:Oxidoreductase n=1 Tax=Marinilabilia rubra TaxID=2162893 RepID=A0A2U2B625_9BACT|nr:Gfo/Idh/MocA family oxidoreductase [Marinilabilia rubra]PWD98505.1 oxidoreductase [Marinilabilia rubra]
MKSLVVSFILLFMSISLPGVGQDQPVKIGIAGLTHSHVHWIFGSEKRGEIEIVGIAEPDKELAQRYADQYDFPMTMVYDSLDEMIAEKNLDGVTAFGSIYEHLAVVEKCAPEGIHVMVEKPLAVNMDHARKMEALAKKYGIHLLTNYETTWYPTNHEAYDMIKNDSVIGDIRKIVVRDGHKGPKKIGVDSEFLDWLTDPKLNGGGAIIDFGCYGVNLSTWLMDGSRPHKVTAVTRQFQPENNPNVDDEAIIILEYDQSVAIIQGSWNWPIGRKDMEIYGVDGVVYSDNRNDLRVRISEGYDGYNEKKYHLDDRPAPYDDPFSWFTAVIKDEVTLEPYSLSSLENNMLVVEILDAAIRSAEEGRTVSLQGN